MKYKTIREALESISNDIIFRLIVIENIGFGPLTLIDSMACTKASSILKYPNDYLSIPSVLNYHYDKMLYEKDNGNLTFITYDPEYIPPLPNFN